MGKSSEAEPSSSKSKKRGARLWRQIPLHRIRRRKVTVFLSGKGGFLQPCSKSKAKLKKHKEEIKEMKKSIKELAEAVKQLQETLLTKPYRPEEKEFPEAIYECCFDCEEAGRTDSQSIFVEGFENLRPRQEIKNALTNFFSSCGKVARVFVPIECKTRFPLGFAFINLSYDVGIDKALERNGSYMEGRKLHVTMAIHRDEHYGFTEFDGCDRCNAYLDKSKVYKGPRSPWD